MTTPDAAPRDIRVQNLVMRTDREAIEAMTRIYERFREMHAKHRREQDEAAKRILYAR